MKVIIQLSRPEEIKALPRLLRHSTGMVLPERTYVLSEEAVRTLSSAGIKYTEIGRDAVIPSLEGVAGKRV